MLRQIAVVCVFLAALVHNVHPAFLRQLKSADRSSGKESLCNFNIFLVKDNLNFANILKTLQNIEGSRSLRREELSSPLFCPPDNVGDSEEDEDMLAPMGSETVYNEEVADTAEDDGTTVDDEEITDDEDGNADEEQNDEEKSDKADDDSRRIFVENIKMSPYTKGDCSEDSNYVIGRGKQRNVDIQRKIIEINKQPYVLFGGNYRRPPGHVKGELPYGPSYPASLDGNYLNYYHSGSSPFRSSKSDRRRAGARRANKKQSAVEARSGKISSIGARQMGFPPSKYVTLARRQFSSPPDKYRMGNYEVSTYTVPQGMGVQNFLAQSGLLNSRRQMLVGMEPMNPNYRNNMNLMDMQ